MLYDDEMQLDYQTESLSGIAYLKAGQGPPLLILHGNGANARVYEGLIQYLQPFFTVLVPDLPGFGNSPAQEYRQMTLYLTQLEQFINRQIKQAYTLIGHSLGGYLAYQLMVRQHTQPVERAIWMEAALFRLPANVRMALPVYGWWYRQQQHSLAHVEARMREWCWEYDQQPAEERQVFLESFLRSDRRVQSMLIGQAPLLWPYQFHKLSQPILCIRGEKQQLVSRQTDWFFPFLPCAHKVTIPQAGHFLIGENDEGLEQAIMGFLQPQLVGDKF